MRVVSWPAYANRAVNPYCALLSDGLTGLGVEVEEYGGFRPATLWSLLRPRGADILHVHWPSWLGLGRSAVSAWAITLGWLALVRLARLTGTRLVWTVHNIMPHERSDALLDRLFWRWFPAMVDGYICLTEGGVAATRERFTSLRGRPYTVTPHGPYRDVYPNNVSREEARGRLGVPPGAPVVCYLGVIRPYKQVPQLLEVFMELKDSNAVLLVAGQPSSTELANSIRELASVDPRVRLFLEFVPDEELQLYLNAADVMVFPYREVLNSGSLLLALSFNRPALVPERGAMGELSAQYGEEWVRTYPGQLRPDKLAEALAWASNRDRGGISFDGYEWHSIAAATLEFYERVATGRDK